MANPTVPVKNTGDTLSAAEVNNVVDSIKTKADSSISFNFQNSPSYTLVLSDAGNAVYQASSSANNLVVPANASVPFPVGTCIIISQQGIGQITIAAASGVQISSPSTTLNTRVQFSSVVLIKYNTDAWTLAGDIAAIPGATVTIP